MRPLMSLIAALAAAGPLCAETGPTGTGTAPTDPAAAAPAAAAPAAPDPRLAQAQALTREFGGTLKGELETAIKSGGPVAAIGVCRERAPVLAADLSARSGWQVGRVSLKARNARIGQPDAWERQVLTRFDERRAAGEPADTLVVAEVVEQDGQRAFRYMKAIPTAEVCLACHGSALTPEVGAALDQAYPEDRARGYAVGDIRGAFSLAKPLD